MAGAQSWGTYLPHRRQFDGRNIQLLYQSLLSMLWIGSIYETLLLLSARGLAADTEEFRSLAHDLGLLRIPLEKHEVAGDKKLEQPLQTVRVPPKNDSTDIYEYSRDDPRRAHIMPWV